MSNNRPRKSKVSRAELRDMLDESSKFLSSSYQDETPAPAVPVMTDALEQTKPPRKKLSTNTTKKPAEPVAPTFQNQIPMTSTHVGVLAALKPIATEPSLAELVEAAVQASPVAMTEEFQLDDIIDLDDSSSNYTFVSIEDRLQPSPSFNHSKLFNLFAIEYSVVSNDLHEAVTNQDEAAIDKILKSGDVPVDCLNEWALTPLFLATMKGNARIVAKLLEAGANKHFSPEGTTLPTPFAMAFQYEKLIEIYQLFVRHNISMLPSFN